MSDPHVTSRTAPPEYEALLLVSRGLAEHRSIPELFRALAGQLHGVLPFDYLALVLHDDRRNELRLTILEPDNLIVPIVSSHVDDDGPVVVPQAMAPQVVEDAQDHEEWEVFSRKRLDEGARLSDDYPLTPDSREEYEAWRSLQSSAR